MATMTFLGGSNVLAPKRFAKDTIVPQNSKGLKLQRLENNDEMFMQRMLTGLPFCKNHWQRNKQFCMIDHVYFCSQCELNRRTSSHEHCQLKFRNIPVLLSQLLKQKNLYKEIVEKLEKKIVKLQGQEGGPHKLQKLEFALQVISVIPSTQGKKDNYVLEQVTKLRKENEALSFLDGVLQYLKSQIEWISQENENAESQVRDMPMRQDQFKGFVGEYVINEISQKSVYSYIEQCLKERNIQKLLELRYLLNGSDNFIKLILKCFKLHKNHLKNLEEHNKVLQAKIYKELTKILKPYEQRDQQKIKDYTGQLQTERDFFFSIGEALADSYRTKYTAQQLFDVKKIDQGENKLIPYSIEKQREFYTKVWGKFLDSCQKHPEQYPLEESTLSMIISTMILNRFIYNNFRLVIQKNRKQEEAKQVVERQKEVARDNQDLTRPRVGTLKTKKIWKDMMVKLQAIEKLVLRMESTIDPTNYTKGEWHDQLVYTSFNFHTVYAIGEFKQMIEDYAKVYKKEEVEKRKGIKVLNELPYSNAFLRMYKDKTQELWKRISTFDPTCEEWCDTKIVNLNVFAVQYLFLTYKIELSMNYFIDYPLTQSWSKFCLPQVKQLIQANEYKFERPYSTPTCSKQFILCSDKYKQCAQLVLDQKFGPEENFQFVDDSSLSYKEPTCVYHAQDWSSYDFYEGQWNNTKSAPQGTGVYIRVGFSFIHFWKDVGVFKNDYSLSVGWKYEQASKTYINENQDAKDGWNYKKYMVDGNVQLRKKYIIKSVPSIFQENQEENIIPEEQANKESEQQQQQQDSSSQQQQIENKDVKEVKEVKEVIEEKEKKEEQQEKVQGAEYNEQRMRKRDDLEEDEIQMGYDDNEGENWYPFGHRYIGNCRDRLQIGEGKMFFHENQPEQEMFEGQWKDHQLKLEGEGLSKIYINSLFEIFKGQRDQEGNLIGQGVYENQIGVKYTSQVWNRQDGEGIIAYTKRNRHYEWKGKWKDLMPYDGEGMFYHYFSIDDYYGWNDAVLAEGKWVNGKCFGKLQYVNGDVFEGEFEYKRLMKIKGKYISSVGYVWEGQWDLEDEENEATDGEGILIIKGEIFVGKMTSKQLYWGVKYNFDHLFEHRTSFRGYITKYGESDGKVLMRGSKGQSLQGIYESGKLKSVFTYKTMGGYNYRFNLEKKLNAIDLEEEYMGSSCPIQSRKDKRDNDFQERKKKMLELQAEEDEQSEIKNAQGKQK